MVVERRWRAVHLKPQPALRTRLEDRRVVQIQARHLQILGRRIYMIPSIRVPGRLAVGAAAIPVGIRNGQECVELALELPIELNVSGVLHELRVIDVAEARLACDRARGALIWAISLEHGHAGLVEEGDYVVPVLLMVSGAEIGNVHAATGAIGRDALVVARDAPVRQLHQSIPAHLDAKRFGERRVGGDACDVGRIGRSWIEARTKREEHSLEAHLRGLCGDATNARRGRVR